MFETAVQEKRTGVLWGLIIGLVALVGLFSAGYVLIARSRGFTPRGANGP